MPGDDGLLDYVAGLGGVVSGVRPAGVVVDELPRISMEQLYALRIEWDDYAAAEAAAGRPLPPVFASVTGAAQRALEKEILNPPAPKTPVARPATTGAAFRPHSPARPVFGKAPTTSRDDERAAAKTRAEEAKARKQAAAAAQGNLF